MMIYRTIDENKPQPPQVLGSSYKVGGGGHIGQFATGNVLRSTSSDRRPSAVHSHQNTPTTTETSLADFSSLSLAKVVPEDCLLLSQAIALGGGGNHLELSKQLLFSPERESSKYVMRPISIKAKNQQHPNLSESNGMMMQTANFPNGPVQEPVMMLSPGCTK